MAMTPYPNYDETFENPSILVSSDGTTWTVPSGLTNPIDATPSGGFNADTELVYDDTNNKLWCFYIGDMGATRRVLVRGSTDGVTWGSEVELFTLAESTEAILSPAVIKDGSTWKMWNVDQTTSPNGLKYRTSTTADGTWSAATSCTFNAISSRDLWHIFVFKDGSTYKGLFVYCDLDSNGADFDTLHVASSTDGLSWTVETDPVISPRPGFWDDRLIYRACAVIKGSDADVWYSHSAVVPGRSDIARTAIPLNVWP